METVKLDCDVPPPSSDWMLMVGNSTNGVTLRATQVAVWVKVEMGDVPMPIAIQRPVPQVEKLYAESEPMVSVAMPGPLKVT